MNNLNIILKEKLRPYTDVMIDNEIVVPKKVKKGVYKIDYPTENSSVTLHVRSYSRYQTKWWFVLEIFYFLISIFGIFDQRFDKYCYTTHCKINLGVSNQTDIKLRIVSPRNNGVVVKIESDLQVQEIENVYKIDEVAKNKQKKLIIGKAFTVLAVVALGIVMLL